jgi:hypothetical protein
VYLSFIAYDAAGNGRGELIFGGGIPGTQTAVPFHSEADLCAKLGVLLRRRVPLSVGGLSGGAADQVAMLLESEKLSGNYVEISWSRPDHWTLREIVKGAAEWETVARADAISTTDFDPESISDSSRNS